VPARAQFFLDHEGMACQKNNPLILIQRTYLKKQILVQNDAKLMPNVVQGGREY